MPSLNRRRVTTNSPAPPPNADYKNGILTTLWEMKKDGKADETIKNVGKSLFRLAKLCNLNNPEAVKTFIATFNRKDGYKRALCYAYDCYVKTNGLTWKKPKYWVASKLPRIPLESQINLIISKSSLKLSTAISISKDTGLRPVECMNLRLRDIDLTKGAVYPTTAKHGSPRVLKLKPKTVTMLRNYLATRHIEINDNLFSYWNSDKYGEYFRKARNKIAEKMNDETLKTIRLYDLRHYFATMLYKKTNDLLFVAQQLGHRNIRNTMIYTQLIQFENDDYTCKVSQNVERDKELIENGFEYVTERDGLKIYRKRK